MDTVSSNPVDLKKLGHLREAPRMIASATALEPVSALCFSVLCDQRLDVCSAADSLSSGSREKPWLHLPGEAKAV